MNQKQITSALGALRMAAIVLASVFAPISYCAAEGQKQVDPPPAKSPVGRKATAFVLPGIDGKPVDLRKEMGKRPVVLVFYRGVW